MTLPRPQPKTVFAVLCTALIAGCNAIGSITPDGDAATRIQISSEPAGAAVYLMGKQAGITPMVISERAIYPVSYTPETEKYYGKVILRKEGCEDFSKRLTRSDVRSGLVAILDCDSGATKTSAQQPSYTPPAATPAPVPVEAARPEPAMRSPILPEQQLEQLRTLQRLQEEGVLTDEEEKKLRKRILNKP